RNVGVQQVELQPPDIHAPHLCAQSSIGKVQVHDDVGKQADRQRVKIVIFKRFLLPACGVKVLPEVSLLVQQPDAYQRNAQIAGSFQMIAREHAQAASKNREALGNPEFGGEIRDQHIFLLC